MFLRQNSQKFGTLAEDALLPKNERNARRLSKTDDVLIDNIVSELPFPSSVVNLHPNPQAIESTPFPVFMFGISVVQVIINSDEIEMHRKTMSFFRLFFTMRSIKVQCS